MTWKMYNKMMSFNVKKWIIIIVIICLRMIMRIKRISDRVSTLLKVRRFCRGQYVFVYYKRSKRLIL